MTLGVEGARVVVLGLGVTGRVVAKILAERGASVVASDANPRADTRGLDGIEVEVGSHDVARAALGHADFVLASPGIAPHSGLLAEAIDRGLPVVSELDLAQRITTARIVAVTGTKGKTTVCRLVERMLGDGAYACGNTEVPFLQAAVEHPDAHAFVVECSSFRLYFCKTFHPQVAVITNFAPDHLDWHPSMDDYRDAKARIAQNQTTDDVFVYPAAQPDLAGMAPDAARVSFGLDESAAAWVDGDDVVVGGIRIRGAGELARRGSHFALDAAAATAAAVHAGAEAPGIERGLTGFVPDRHRLELVGERCGVRYYNDSMATNPFAAVAAIRSFDSVVLIAGGRKKVPDLSPLASEAARLRGVVTIGEAADDVAAVFEGSGVPVIPASTMRDAVEQAMQNARSGDVVLLAPACASQDAYKSYAERGDDFVGACRLHGVRM